MFNTVSGSRAFEEGRLFVFQVLQRRTVLVLQKMPLPECKTAYL